MQNQLQNGLQWLHRKLLINNFINKDMKRLITLTVSALLFVVGAYAQNEMHIIQKTGTTVISLDEVKSIELTDEAWSEWEVIGKATYNYGGFLWTGGLTDATVSYSEYLLNDTDAKFDITYINEDEEQGPLGDWGMAGGYHFTIEYNKKTGECKVPLQVVYDYEGYGQVYVCDIPTFSDKYTYDEYPCTYDADKGKFTLNVIYFLSTQLGASLDYQFGVGEETIQLDGFKEYDYSFDMTYQGSYMDVDGNEYAVIQATKGVDVSKYQIAVVPADSDMDAIVAGMIDGSAECLTMTESTEIKYPIYKSDNYVIIAVTYDENEEPVDAYTQSLEFFLIGENPWESLGYASYTDDVVSTLFDAPNPTYKVEVRESKDKPGLYRIINPYGAAFPYNEEGDYDASQEYYIEIDATDPDAVYIPGVYDTGCNLGFGNFQVSSMAYYYMAEGKTKEEVKDAGLCGNLVDGVITFPVNALLVAMPEYENGAWLYANTLGLFMLDMSNMTATPDEPAKAHRTKFFDINAKKAFDTSLKTKSANKVSLKQGDVKQNARLKALPPVKMVDEAQKAVLDI